MMFHVLLAAVLASPAPTPSPPYGRYYLIHVQTLRSPYKAMRNIAAGPFDVYNDCLKRQREKPYVFSPLGDESYECEIRFGKQ